MTGRLTHIRHYPIKAIGDESLDRVSLVTGQCLSGDRGFAILHEAGIRHLNADGGIDGWLPKSSFLRGVTGAALQAVRGRRQADGRLQLWHPEAGVFVFSGADDGAALIEWLRPLWPADKPPPVRLITAPVALTDMRQRYVSILSLSSLNALERAEGRVFGIDRWRANFWVEGLEPWAERDWAGRRLRIGGADLVVRQRITRCHATSANTETGQVEIDMLATLNALQGDADFGIYAEVVAGGEVATGNRVEVMP